MELDSNLILKIISIPSLFLLCFVFGIMPFAIKKCRMNEAFLSFANTFSGGLFFGIGQFHLLNEGVEKLEKYSKLPWPYFLAASGYSLILFIQKVVFGYIVPSAEQNLENKEKIGGLLNENEDSDDTRPSIAKAADNSFENINASSSSIDKADLIDNEEKSRPSTDPNAELNVHIDNNDELNLKKKKLSAFILLLSLSIHGLFECLALGIQTVYKNTFFLFIALMIHKWAEAFALGILFVKAKFSKKFYYLIITLFAIVGPIGVAVGIVLAATAGELVEGIFLSISTGTFLYVSCSEVIIEEFSTPQKRYIKFALYLFGCVFAAGLSLMEYFFE
jgi:zinc transporter 1/2/3